MNPPPESVLKPALKLLSIRSRSVQELRERLLKKGLFADDVAHCLDWLAERDLLNDLAFGRALTRDRIRFSPRSPFLLRRELSRKGVRPPVAEEAVSSVLEEEEVTEIDLAVQSAEGWVQRQSARTRSALLAGRFTQEREMARGRLYGFLSRRGFRGDAARRGMEAGDEKARELED